jgi:hypothetical protein
MKSEIWANFGFCDKRIGKSCRFALNLAILEPKITDFGQFYLKKQRFWAKIREFWGILVDFALFLGF